MEMETQISMNGILSQVELDDNEKVDGSILLKDNKTSRRRTHVDILIIFLVFARFLQHVLEIYGTTNEAMIKNPTNTHSGDRSKFLIEEEKYTIIPLDHWNFLSLEIGNRYFVPLLYFLSGGNVFYSLCKRTEREFRDERVHRLLVPILVMSLLQFIDRLTVFAPLDKTCQMMNENDTIASYEVWNRTRLECQTYFNIHDYQTPFLSTLLQNHWVHGLLSTRHLTPLFIFSQMFGFWFCVFHPDRNKQGVPEITYCGSTCCCCSRKPLSCITRTCCCINFLCKPASNPAEFKAAVNWFLGGPIRIVVVPGLFLLLTEGLINGSLSVIFFGSLELILDGLISNMSMYLFGFAMAATEFDIPGGIAKRYRWHYFTMGCICCIGDSILILLTTELVNTATISHKTVFVIPFMIVIKIFGSWMFVLGIVNIAKEYFRKDYMWLSQVREASLPFFLMIPKVMLIYLTGVFWVPYLRSLPFTILIGTLLTGCISFIITKVGPLRYLFGLRYSNNSFFPGNSLRGFIPVIILSIFTVLFNIVLALLIDNK